MRKRKVRKKEKRAGDGLSILDLANQHMLARVPANEAAMPVFGTGNFRKKVVSESLAVLPRQIPEAMAEAKRLGAAVPHFDDHGRPVFDNSGNFRDYVKKRGFTHRGYY